jgi:hypothetical protein
MKSYEFFAIVKIFSCCYFFPKDWPESFAPKNSGIAREGNALYSKTTITKIGTDKP